MIKISLIFLATIFSIINAVNYSFATTIKYQVNGSIYVDQYSYTNPLILSGYIELNDPVYYNLNCATCSLPNTQHDQIFLYEIANFSLNIGGIYSFYSTSQHSSSRINTHYYRDMDLTVGFDTFDLYGEGNWNYGWSILKVAEFYHENGIQYTTHGPPTEYLTLPYTIKIHGEGAAGYFIDDFEMTQCPVPEPNTILLFCIGIVGYKTRKTFWIKK